MSILAVSFEDADGGSRLASVSELFIELKLKFLNRRVRKFLDSSGGDGYEDEFHGLNCATFMTLSPRAAIGITSTSEINRNTQQFVFLMGLLHSRRRFYGCMNSMSVLWSQLEGSHYYSV